MRNYYSNLSPNEKKLKFADFLGHVVIPTVACGFVAFYWIFGMMKYNSPDWSAYTFILPDLEVNRIRKYCFKKPKSYSILKENLSYEEMMYGTVDHVKSFFDANSTLMKTLEEAGTNLTNFVSESLQNSSVLQTWNKTLQDTINTF